VASGSRCGGSRRDLESALACAARAGRAGALARRRVEGARGERALAPSWERTRARELVAGRVVTYEVVLPEGLHGGRDRGATRGGDAVRADEFLAVARDPAVARDSSVEAASRATLFPRPYRMPHGLSAKQVARVPSSFHAQWAPLEADAKARGLGSTRS
jgi:hypothetical protein